MERKIRKTISNATKRKELEIKSCAHLNIDDMIDLQSAAALLSISYSQFRSLLFYEQKIKITVYHRHPLITTSRSRYYVHKPELFSIHVKPNKSQIYYLPEGVYLTLPEAARYMAIPCESALKRIFDKDVIFHEEGAVVCPQENSENYMVGNWIWTVSLKHLNRYMRTKVRLHFYSSLYYHRILYDDMPIFPDDPRYTRIENIRDIGNLSHAELVADPMTNIERQKRGVEVASRSQLNKKRLKK